jgi:6-phosphogluconate dehydrogenase
MVHNGIEYADIQLIAEAYDVLRHGVGLHTYRRVDREGTFHARWAEDGAEVRTDA